MRQRMMHSYRRDQQSEKEAPRDTFIARFWKNCCHAGAGVPVIQDCNSKHHLSTFVRLMGFCKDGENYAATNIPVVMVRVEEPVNPLEKTKSHFWEGPGKAFPNYSLEARAGLTKK